MKKTFSIITILITLALFACKKYEPHQSDDVPQPVFPAYEIGDYFHNDTLQGIVFATIAGGTSGLMVSLDETILPWCVPNYTTKETGATNPNDGWYNTNILMTNYDLNHYPAIQWSHKRNTWQMLYQPHYQVSPKQWYMPSSNELRYLLENQAAVNRTLDSLGYPTLEDKTYWSSTELGTRSAAALRVQNGSVVIGDSVKDLEFFVRAIRNF